MSSSTTSGGLSSSPSGHYLARAAWCSASAAPRQDASFPSLVGMHRSLHAFTKGPHSGEDLEYLLALILAGKLRVDVGWRGSWTRIAEAADALFGRRVAGKAVLDVD